jgi:predicted porin
MYTALNGGFGSVRLGAANTPSLGAQGGRTPFGTKMGGGFGTTMGTSHVRESNSIVYVAPTMAGFTASLGHAFRVNADTLPALAYAGNKNDIGLAYAAGPLRANASFFSGQGNGQQNFMVQYDLGAATIYGGMHKEAVGGVANNSGTNLAVKYALNGTTSVMANIGKRDDKTAADQDQNITGLGMDYALSKRTTTYIRYENRKINNVVLATAAKQATTTAFGIQHNF